jgi:hypothetical protein
MTMSNDRGTAYADAACPVHTDSTDGGACFHRAQGGEASEQEQRDDHALHGYSPWLEPTIGHAKRIDLAVSEQNCSVQSN